MSDISFSRYLWFVVNLNSVDVPCLIGVDFRGTNVLVLSFIEAVKRKPWETSQHTQTGHTAAVMARQLTSHLAGNRSLPKKTVTGFGHNLLPVSAQNCGNPTLNKYSVSNLPDPCIHQMNIQSVIRWSPAYTE